jgi:hypothetical protein
VKVPQKIAHAYLEGDELVLEDFRGSDPDVVAFVCDAEGVARTREETAHGRRQGMSCRIEHDLWEAGAATTRLSIDL